MSDPKPLKPWQKVIAAAAGAWMLLVIVLIIIFFTRAFWSLAFGSSCN